jgi:hypothetical protein
MEKGWKKGIPAEWAADISDLGRQWLVFASERVNANIYQELWDSVFSPRSRGRILREILSFGGFGAGPHRYNRPAAVYRILDSGRLAAIFPGLEPAWLCYLARF